jgi:hypothetical protein
LGDFVTKDQPKGPKGLDFARALAQPKSEALTPKVA